MKNTENQTNIGQGIGNHFYTQQAIDAKTILIRELVAPTPKTEGTERPFVVPKPEIPSPMYVEIRRRRNTINMIIYLGFPYSISFRRTQQRLGVKECFDESCLFVHQCWLHGGGLKILAQVYQLIRNSVRKCFRYFREEFLRHWNMSSWATRIGEAEMNSLPIDREMSEGVSLFSRYAFVGCHLANDNPIINL